MRNWKWFLFAVCFVSLCSALVFPGDPAHEIAFYGPALTPGASHTVTRDLTLNVAQGYINTATADYNGVVTESNEADNTATDIYDVTSAGHKVSGTVYYSTRGLRGVTVKLVIGVPNNSPLQTTTTNTSGQYSFSGVADGAYSVRVDAPSAEYISWKALSIQVAGSDVTRDMDLPKKMALLAPASGSNVSETKPTLTWKLNPQAARYSIQVNITSPWTLVEQGQGTTTSYAVTTALTAGTNYTWQIDAYDSANHHVGTTERAFTFTVAALPDLVVESLTHSPANPTTTDLITFTAVVKNVGMRSAGVSTLMFKIGGETPGAPRTLFPVPALGSGASHTVTRKLTLNVAQNYINTATADYNGVVTESNEADNTTKDSYTVIPAGTLSTIFGKIIYNGRPVTGKQKVNFWARDENSNQAFPISPTYNPPDGTYSIPNMPTGKYGIRVYIDDAEPFDGKCFPADYYGFTSPIEVNAPSPVNKDLVCRKLMHLISPIDNGSAVGPFPPPYNTQTSPVTFQWDAIAEASKYQVIVNLYQDSPYSLLQFGLFNEFGITDTQKTIALPQCGTNRHYQFQLTAYNSNNVWVGQLMIVYTNAEGWDYRFKITELPPIH